MSLYSRLIRLVMAPASMCPVPVRIWLLNKCPDIAIDSSALIREKVIISVSGVTIKKNAFINRNCFLYSTSPLSSIVIMENAYIGPNSSLICQSHKIGGSNLRAGEDMFGDIVIGEGSWLGANVTVLPSQNCKGLRRWGLVLWSQNRLSLMAYMLEFRQEELRT
ncbi:acyltransferase [Lacticaseibacillus sharpeae]|uniref:acyltransferase n=1 Tax=Lacticaseibacillus sharpeae TaxID=1626 RepID=UPI0006D0AE75|nr:hypothetical protein [Lacticaseibacillus sharpeae]